MLEYKPGSSQITLLKLVKNAGREEGLIIRNINQLCNQMIYLFEINIQISGCLKVQA